MRNINKERISIKFLIFLLVLFFVIVIYISNPNEIKKPKKDKTFEELLEYSKIENNYSSPEKGEKKGEVIKKYDILPINVEEINTIQPQNEINNSQYTQQDYYRLLDNLAEYPAKNINIINNIVNKLLSLKGYKQNTVRVISTDIDQSKAKAQGNYMVANFDFVSGNLYLSSKMLYDLDTKVIIAILVHELDHFHKLAKICKYMGVQEFKKLFEDNNIKNINTTFWSNASSQTDIKNFDSEFYKNALKRFITQNNLELTSSYSDFYRIAENMRNPLEVSAYKESDNVYKHYNIPIKEGPIKQLTKKFNDIDWAIYNSISKNPLIKDERVAIFDYFYLKAILEKFPEFKQQFDICINQKNGDLTNFWYAFENSVSSFYQKGKMDNETYEKIFSLLTITDNKIKRGITNIEISNALKYKINTLSSNLVYPNAIENLKKTTTNYLKYIKQENITDSEQELKSILTLICIENELYKNNNDKAISLYYIKMPESLNNLYNIQNKKQKYLFIYNNSAFKESIDSAIKEQDHLINLLNKQRLDIRIKN